MTVAAGLAVSGLIVFGTFTSLAAKIGGCQRPQWLYLEACCVLLGP